MRLRAARSSFSCHFAHASNRSELSWLVGVSCSLGTPGLSLWPSEWPLLDPRSQVVVRKALPIKVVAENVHTATATGSLPG